MTAMDTITLDAHGLELDGQILGSAKCGPDGYGGLIEVRLYELSREEWFAVEIRTSTKHSERFVRLQGIYMSEWFCGNFGEHDPRRPFFWPMWRRALDFFDWSPAALELAQRLGWEPGPRFAEQSQPANDYQPQFAWNG